MREIRYRIAVAVFLVGMLLLSIVWSYGQKNKIAGTDVTESMSDVETLDETVTVMIYVTGSDLEAKTAAATVDMQEMADSGVDVSKVNVLLFTGGSETWHNSMPSDRNGIYRLSEIGFEPVEELEQKSMGDPENLSRFLRYSRENYPAQNYYLILWDHGNGPVMGYGLDKQYDNDAMTLPEIKVALENSPFGTGDRLGLIGFDACLMASEELVCTIAPFADYLVASQETEPGFGWNYRFLKDCGKVSTVELAKRIVASYIDYCQEYFEENSLFQNDVTLSVVDLSYAEQLKNATEALFEKATEEVSGNYSKLAFARVNSRALGRASTGSEYDLVDLKSLMEMMVDRYPEETGKVLEILEKSVVTNGVNTDGCNGISLYYPFFNKHYYEKSWGETYRNMGVLPCYAEYINRYSAVWLGTDLLEYFKEGMIPESIGTSTYSLTLSKMQQEAYAAGGYFILRKTGENKYAMVYYSRDIQYENGRLSTEFDGNVFYYMDNFVNRWIPPISLTDKHDTVMEYKMNPMFYRDIEGGREFATGEQLFSYDTQSGALTLKGLYELEETDDKADAITYGKRREIHLSDWDFISMLNISSREIARDENGVLQNYWDWKAEPVITYNDLPTKAGFRLTREPLYEDGYEYYLMFDVMDVQGNRYSSEILPLLSVAAPPKESYPKQALVWENDSSVDLLQTEELGLSLKYLKQRPEGEGQYFLVYENRSNELASVTVTNMVINGEVFVPQCNLILPKIAPGSTIYKSLQGILLAAGMEQTKINSLSLDVKSNGESAPLLQGMTFEIDMRSKQEAEVFFAEKLDALAEKQVLLNEDLKISLEGFGYLPNSLNGDPASDGTPVTGLFRVENNSDKTVEIGGGYMILNGCNRSFQAFASVPAGGVTYLEYSTSVYTLSQQRVSSISDAKVVFSIDGVYRSFPIRLDQKGTGNKVAPEGELIYEDAYMRMYAVDAKVKKADDKYNYEWTICVEAKTETSFTMDHRRVENGEIIDEPPYIRIGYYYPGNTVGFYTLSRYNLEENASLDIASIVQTDTEEYVSGIITLPRPEPEEN